MYAPLNCDSISDSRLKQVFQHANAYLCDVYGMLRTLPPEDKDGGGGNFSVALVLLCVIDGLATEVWPGYEQEEDQGQRFKRLIRDRLHWGPQGKGKWADKGTAAKLLYTEVRNPLVHELGADTTDSPARPGYTEPVIGKWGRNVIPPGMRDITKIEALSEWDDTWPIMHEERDNEGNVRFRLVTAALYWAVKRLAQELIAEVLAIKPAGR